MTGTLWEREHRRRLGVTKVLEGWPCSTVADILDVSTRAVQQWVKVYRDGGPEALTRQPMPDRPIRCERPLAPPPASLMRLEHHQWGA